MNNQAQWRLKALTTVAAVSSHHPAVYFPRPAKPSSATHAWLRFAYSRPDAARADLDEAEQIARRGPMPLFLADIALYRARFFHDRTALAEARRLVDKHGYGRRIEEVEAVEAASKSWADLGDQE